MQKAMQALILSVLLLGGLFTSQPSSADAIRIMPFGDDWTKGRWGHVGYRYPLWFMLQDAGFDVDYVGRVMAPQEPVNTDWYPGYLTTFDRDHEGRAGTLSSVLIASADRAAETYQPHVVLLMAGGWDIYQFGPGGVSTTSNNLPLIIQAFRDHVPDVIFLLSTTPPWLARLDGDPVNTEYGAPLAAAQRQVVLDNDSPESPIYLIENFTGFNTSTMLGPDQLAQPNLTGENWMAGNFFEVLEDVLPDIDTGAGEGFSINAGLNDAWFNPSTPGQGVFLTVFPDIEMMFLAWFTFDTSRPAAGVEAVVGEPGHRWLTAFGPYTGNVAELEVELTFGGVFNNGVPAPQQQADYGEILIEFEDCASASMSYDLFGAGVSGIVPLQRIANDNLEACETLSQPAGD